MEAVAALQDRWSDRGRSMEIEAEMGWQQVARGTTRVQEKKPEIGAYKVVHTGRVAVRVAPDTSAKAVGAKVPGERVVGSEMKPGWLKLAGGKEEWMLIHGRSLGLGLLLERTGLTEAVREKSREERHIPSCTLWSAIFAQRDCAATHIIA